DRGAGYLTSVHGAFLPKCHVASALRATRPAGCGRRPRGEGAAPPGTSAPEPGEKIAPSNGGFRPDLLLPARRPSVGTPRTTVAAARVSARCFAGMPGPGT